ncbi:MAG: flagellar biosynthesis protein FlhB [Proteobacteria bacterium]|nr:flagellar biosynthesis protein FlhB [Pseudomonadota bacterium]MBU1708881.1 flagellar biosynthesis protein FlhB [Pseudomonadota bacterium]
MAEESSGQEKTEEPTSRRLSEARKKGDVAKSQEVPSAAVLLASLLTFYLTGNYMLERCYIIMRHYLGNLHSINIIPGNMTGLLKQSLIFSGMVMLPLMIVIVVVALLANYAQIGFLFTTEKITPKLEKIDPIKGISNLFSKQMVAQTVKSIAKLLLIGYVAYTEIKKAQPAIVPLMDQEPLQILLFMARTSFWIFLKSALAIAVLAAADYAFQRWHFMEKMKMTKQEIKEEAKQTEGDPYVKGRIRAIQMEMARRRMMQEVPTADVVITNPTHLSVALKYNVLTMTAPMVVAKGAGVIAFRIREIAQENGIPIIEDKPLARALYKTTDLNETVPENLFHAVAEILAYVYNLKRKSA